MDSHVDILEKLKQELEAGGFECYPFKVGWYNNQVQDVFQLPYADDTFAVIAVSIPSMFEKSFIPYLQSLPKPISIAKDPIDRCIKQKIEDALALFPDDEIDTMYDYELNHNRRPKILVQTAGHLAGAAYYYQRHDVNDQPWTPRQKICGVCIHPKYGGWFALRAVLVFKDKLVPNLEQTLPVDSVQTDEDRIKLLEQFNYAWQDWSFRDIIDVKDRYSDTQKLYFSTQPKERLELINRLAEGEDVLSEGARCLDQGHSI